MVAAKSFYENILGFKIDDRYTINKNGNYDTGSYMQLYTSFNGLGDVALGLYKDIDKPYTTMPENGTVPSFIVDDIHSTLCYFQEQKVKIAPVDQDNGSNSYIIENISDEGYVDLFFFFCDLDNNSFVIRQNLSKTIDQTTYL